MYTFECLSINMMTGEEHIITINVDTTPIPDNLTMCDIYQIAIERAFNKIAKINPHGTLDSITLISC